VELQMYVDNKWLVGEVEQVFYEQEAAQRECYLCDEWIKFERARRAGEVRTQ
jgi:hypothetical protein